MRKRVPLLSLLVLVLGCTAQTPTKLESPAPAGPIELVLIKKENNFSRLALDDAIDTYDRPISSVNYHEELLQVLDGTADMEQLLPDLDRRLNQ